MSQDNSESLSINIADALGAIADDVSTQALYLYIPDKDQHGNEIGTQRKWVLEAANIFAKIGGGVTVLPAAEGGWQRPDGNIIWERPVLVYTFIRADEFFARLAELREFLHRMGRETNQGEVAIQLDDRFYRITQFDKAVQ